MTISVLHIVPSTLADNCAVSDSLVGSTDAFGSLGVQTRFSSDRLTPEDLSNITVVHIHRWGYDAAIHAARAARSRGVPYIISPHGDFTENSTRPVGLIERIESRLRDRRLIRNAAAVTGLNTMEVARLRIAGRNRRIELLSYGWRNADDVQEYRNSEPVLLILDPILPVAGATRILKVMAELGNENNGWKVVFAGHGNFEAAKALEAAVARKGMGDRVTFEMKSYIQTRKEWLGRARSLVSPWLRVAFPFSIMQALAWGVPALCTDQVAMDGVESAVRVCRPDRDSLREGLRALLRASEAERQAASQRAREFARKNLDWSEVAPRFAELYESVI